MSDKEELSAAKKMKLDDPSVEAQEPRCKMYLKKKRRFCKMIAGKFPKVHN